MGMYFILLVPMVYDLHPKEIGALLLFFLMLLRLPIILHMFSIPKVFPLSIRLIVAIL